MVDAIFSTFTQLLIESFYLFYAIFYSRKIPTKITQQDIPTKITLAQYKELLEWGKGVELFNFK